MSPPPHSLPPPAPSSAEEGIRFDCWSCNTSLNVPRSMAGVSGPCPSCGVMLAAPSLSTMPLAPSPVATDESESSPMPRSGFRPPSAMPPPVPDLAQSAAPRETKDLPLLTQLWIAWPVLLATVGGAVGGLCGGLALAINRGIFRRNASGLGSYAWSGMVSVMSVIVWVVAAGAMTLMPTSNDASVKATLKSEVAKARTLVTSTGCRLDLDDLRFQTERQVNGVFGEGDYSAAESAARDAFSSGQSIGAMVDAYAAALSERAKVKRR